MKSTIFILLLLFSPLALRAQTPPCNVSHSGPCEGLAAVVIEDVPAAPVPQAIQCAKLSPAGVGAYPSPLVSYNIGFTSKTNATWTLEVTPTPPTITENGTPWGTNVAPGFYTALTTGGAESIQLAYNTPTYIAAELCEYPGQLTLDVAAPILTGTSQVAASNPLLANSGDLLISYGWQNTSNYLTVQPAAGFALEPSGTSMYQEDQTVTAAGSVTGGAQWSGVVNWTSGIVALKQAVQPVTLTASPSSTVCYDTGVSLFGQNQIQFNIMELENGVWQTVGSLTVNPNCTVTGSIAVSPNYTDTSGNVQLTASLPVLAGTAPPLVLYTPVGSLLHGSTGIVVTFVLFQNAPGGFKSTGLTLTP